MKEEEEEVVVSEVAVDQDKLARPPREQRRRQQKLLECFQKAQAVIAWHRVRRAFRHWHTLPSSSSSTTSSSTSSTSSLEHEEVPREISTINSNHSGSSCGSVRGSVRGSGSSASVSKRSSPPLDTLTHLLDNLSVGTTHSQKKKEVAGKEEEEEDELSVAISQTCDEAVRVVQRSYSTPRRRPAAHLPPSSSSCCCSSSSSCSCAAQTKALLEEREQLLQHINSQEQQVAHYREEGLQLRRRLVSQQTHSKRVHDNMRANLLLLRQEHEACNEELQEKERCLEAALQHLAALLRSRHSSATTTTSTSNTTSNTTSLAGSHDKNKTVKKKMRVTASRETVRGGEEGGNKGEVVEVEEEEVEEEVEAVVKGAPTRKTLLAQVHRLRAELVLAHSSRAEESQQLAEENYRLGQRVDRLQHLLLHRQAHPQARHTRTTTTGANPSGGPVRSIRHLSSGSADRPIVTIRGAGGGGAAAGGGGGSVSHSLLVKPVSFEASRLVYTQAESPLRPATPPATAALANRQRIPSSSSSSTSSSSTTTSTPSPPVIDQLEDDEDLWREEEEDVQQEEQQQEEEEEGQGSELLHRLAREPITTFTSSSTSTPVRVSHQEANNTPWRDLRLGPAVVTTSPLNDALVSPATSLVSSSSSSAEVAGSSSSSSSSEVQALQLLDRNGVPLPTEEVQSRLPVLAQVLSRYNHLASRHRHLLAHYLTLCAGYREEIQGGASKEAQLAQALHAAEVENDHLHLLLHSRGGGQEVVEDVLPSSPLIHERRRQEEDDDQESLFSDSPGDGRTSSRRRRRGWALPRRALYLR
eukprot:scaffold2549_cov177-Ochromonas_danica.AAC.13